jgi:hypothetical protein
MCGICGVMSLKLGFGEITRFKDLFTMAQLRGDEGSGMIGIPHKDKIGPGDVRVKKTTWSSGHLVTTQDFHDVIKGDVDILVGHARQPTKGGTKIDMVHPHRSGDIILVHNGTMTSVDHVVVKQTDSDSRMITECLAKHSLQHLVDTSWGAMCLIWVDRRDQTLNFYRNNERPLIMCEERHSIMENSHIKNVYWSSESGMLHLALGRYSGYVKERHKYFALPVNEHWKYPLKVDQMIPEVTEIKKRVPVSAVPTNGYSTWDQWGDDNQLPFVPSRPANSERWAGSTAVTTKKPYESFVYTPPEYRQKPESETVVHASIVLSRSRRDAETATKLREEALKRLELRKAAMAKKGGDPQDEEYFPTPTKSTAVAVVDDISKYAETNPARVFDLVSAGPCVWCEEKPALIDGRLTTVFPVKYSENHSSYVCGDCTKDLDVRRLVGISK